MKFVKLLKYVEKSYGDNPSFLIIMSDRKEYISNGCQFVENTEENIIKLILEYDCATYIKELFNSECEGIECVTDALYMFCGCTDLTDFEVDLPNLVLPKYSA